MIAALLFVGVSVALCTVVWWVRPLVRAIRQAADAVAGFMEFE